MSKKLFVLFAILVSGFAIFAQSEMRDVVYLKNGSVIKGTIETVGEYVRIDTPDGSMFFYEMNEIEKIVKEKVAMPETKVETSETKVATNQNSMPLQNNNYIFMPPRKSTFGAGFLSFLIPGAGELYATDWEQGWRTVFVTYVMIPAIGGLVGIMVRDSFIGGIIAATPLMAGMCVTSIFKAVKLAKEVNLKNGYLSFQIGDKAHLGVRPELSYNNMMMPSGSMSPQLTTGIGMSLSF